MYAKKQNRVRPRVIGCFATLLAILAIPGLYYGIQAYLRSKPITPTQYIAHRGGPIHAPENTLSAFRTAIQQGVDWLEFDVQMTKDDELVVIHDESVDRTTNGMGEVRNLTLDQIRALDAGSGEQVPTFEEVVRLAKMNGVKILPETKSAHLYPGIETKLMQELEELDYVDKTVVQSFEPASLDTLHRLNPDLNFCALYGLWQFDISNPPADSQFVCPMAEMVLIFPSMIQQAHREGRQVFVWFGVMEHPLMFRAMRFFGADGLMSDDPLLLVQSVAP